MILAYTLLLVVIGILPWLSGMSGEIYLLGSTALNLGFLSYAWRLKFHDRTGLAWQTFKFSIWHILGLFVVLLIDHAVKSVVI